MNANPLPVAEFLPTAPGGTAAGPGGASESADPLHAGDAVADPRGAADFAALLQSAGLAVEPPVVAPETGSEAAPEGASAPATSGSALDGLLFMATVQGTTPISPPGIPAAGQPAGSPSVAGGPESPAPAVPPARALVDAALADAGTLMQAARQDSSSPPLDPATSSGGPARAPIVEFLANDPLAPAAVPYARQASRADPNAEPPPSLVLASSADPAKRPALDTLLRETSAKRLATPAIELPPSLAPPTSAAAPTPSVSVKIDPPVHDPAWRIDVAGRIASLVTRGVEHAELRITPPELGPVELRIDVRGGEATLAIVATQATTREALEQALPLLRDMLAQQGLSLGQATVHDGRGDNQAAGDRERRTALPGESRTQPEIAGAPPPRPGLVRRLIDVFA